MLEAADKSLPIVEDSSVNPNGVHVKELELLADEVGVPKGETLPMLSQSNELDCTWENDLKQNDKKQGG
jgi:hypothetical protein